MYSEELEQLFHDASEYRFGSFTKRLQETESSLSGDDLREVRLMRAQIKLLAGDASFAADLKKAGRTDAAPRFPCLNRSWRTDSPNRLVVFPADAGALAHFLSFLSPAAGLLDRFFADAGGGMARQLQSEILYFSGEFDEAVRIARDQCKRRHESPLDSILALYVLFRCHLATGDSVEAEKAMMEMIRYSKSHSECVSPYRTIREWANMTTGWSGDTPRFYHAPDGGALPVLDDRLVAIQKGIARLSPTEAPFSEFAAHSYPNARTMRQLYMDIFLAVYAFQVGDFAQTRSRFLHIYGVSMDTGLIMPFVEYGKQIIPLLRHVMSDGISCSHDWIIRIISLAERYEESLHAYRT